MEDLRKTRTLKLLRNALLDMMTKKPFEEITEKIIPSSYSNIKEFYTNMIMNVICYIESNKKIFKAMILKNDDTSFFKIFNNTCVLYIYNMLQREEKKGINHDIPIKLVAEFYAGAVISTITYWIKDSSKMTSNQLCDYIIKLIFENSHN